MCLQAYLSRRLTFFSVTSYAHALHVKQSSCRLIFLLLFILFFYFIPLARQLSAGNQSLFDHYNAYLHKWMTVNKCFQCIKVVINVCQCDKSDYLQKFSKTVFLNCYRLVPIEIKRLFVTLNFLWNFRYSNLHLWWWCPCWRIG